MVTRSAMKPSPLGRRRTLHAAQCIGFGHGPTCDPPAWRRDLRKCVVAIACQRIVRLLLPAAGRSSLA